MKLVRLNSVLALSIAGSLALAGCSGDDDDNNNNNNRPDAGPVTDDAGTPDSGVETDAGTPDSGVPPSPCPIGTEGCGCTSTAQEDTLLQDDCEADLVCVPWDLISGQNDLLGPVQSCVKPCETSADCGAEQTCVDSGLGEESGAGRICADRVAEFDEFCGFGRGLTSQVPGEQIETSGEIVGCAEGTACLIGLAPHPDEGVCLTTCQDDTECPESTPLCNPEVLSSANGPVGVCSVRVGGPGGICGTDVRGKQGFTSGCDTSGGRTLICLQGILADGFGQCIQICNQTDEPCAVEDASGLMQTCEPFPELFNPQSNFDGICSVDCTNFPDNCSGDGGNSLGQYCVADVGFQGIDNSFSYCADRSGPPLAETTFTDEGQLLNQGDNCFEAGTQCPEPSFCLPVEQGTSICTVGCNTSTTAMTASCTELTGTATTCLGDFLNEEVFGAGAGICGETE